MSTHSPDQRNSYYLIEAARTGIHKSLLAALYATQEAPALTDHETGLGIAPANRIPLAQVNTFPEQVKYAANTIRSLTSQLTAEGWQGHELWDRKAGCYSDRLLRRVAEGYRPPTTDALAAQLEPVDGEALITAYRADWTADYQRAHLPDNLIPLDHALLHFVEQLPLTYYRLAYQRHALLEAIRLWRKLDTHQAVVIALEVPDNEGLVNEASLDQALLKFVDQVDRYFSSYPNQRESLLRLVQLWCELPSREAAMGWLLQAQPDADDFTLPRLTPALIAFIQRLPDTYKGLGEQRFALTEGYRCWHQLDSRTAAIQALGLEPQALMQATGDPQAMAQTAIQIDRTLLNFWATVPTLYTGTAHQQDALLQLVMLWRHIGDRLPLIHSLLDEVRQMERANRDTLEAMPPPRPTPPAPRPLHWTPQTIDFAASIVASGSLTWAEATTGGMYPPPNQATVDAIVRIALLAQEARDRIGRPFSVIRWYSPPATTTGSAVATHRHTIGDAIAFYCRGLTGQQVYWALDPWWPGGLSRYPQYPYLCYIDARGDRARWLNEDPWP